MTRASRGAAASRGELAAVVGLAAPIAFIQVGLILLGVVDTMMVGRLSQHALAAAALGHTFTMALLLVGLGIMMGLDPLVAQAHGARDRRAIGALLQRGTVLALVLTVPISVAMWYAAPLLRLLQQHESLLEDAAAYVRHLIPGNAAFFLFLAMRHTAQAMSITRPMMVAIVVANGFNLIANYALVFGNLGFPALGLTGSATATSLSRWVMASVLFLASRPYLRRYWRGWSRASHSRQGYAAMLKIGGLISVQVALEVWVFSATGFLMGSLGEQALAGHQIALNLASLSFMVPLGIGGAAATRVGNAIGRGDDAGARRAARVCLVLGAGVMVFFAAVFTLIPEALARLYTDEPAVIAMAASLIPVAALFQVFDGTQVVASGVLRGAADTRVPAGIMLVGFWVIGLPLGSWLAFPMELGPPGLWWGLCAGLVTVAVLLLLRIRRRFRGALQRYGITAAEERCGD